MRRESELKVEFWGFIHERLCYDEVFILSKWLRLAGTFEVKIVRNKGELYAVRI
jgi:hypothetical protein